MIMTNYRMITGRLMWGGMEACVEKIERQGEGQSQATSYAFSIPTAFGKCEDLVYLLNFNIRSFRFSQFKNVSFKIKDL